MTDLERTLELLNTLGIKHAEVDAQSLEHFTDLAEGTGLRLKTEQGYTDFVFQIYFNADGSYNSSGVEE